MEHKLIKTENYLLVVSDDEIKMDDYYLDDTNSVRVAITEAESYWTHRKKYKKVVSHLPLNNSPILQGVDLLPELEQEDDVDGIGDEFYPLNDDLYPNSSLVRKGVKYGYNKARERYKYTEDDIYKAIQYGREVHYTNDQPFIQSLSQPKLPVVFKQGNAVDGKTYTSVTRRHDGFTVWIGEYVYEN